MCGRYASSRSPQVLAEEFEVDQVDVREKLEPDYNVAPTKDVYAVLSRPPSADRAAPAVRRLRVVRWGLIPSWAKDAAIGKKMINARVETVTDKPAYRKAFAARRCLLPADGFFEWYPTAQRSKSGKPLKQPFFIHPADGSGVSMAGLYEIWRDPTRSRDDPEAFRWTCTVLTTQATDELGHIHERMPLLVDREHYPAWLDPATDHPSRLLDILIPALPAAGGQLEAVPVNTEVNDVRNNGPHLVAPVATEPPAPA